MTKEFVPDGPQAASGSALRERRSATPIAPKPSNIAHVAGSGTGPVDGYSFRPSRGPMKVISK